MLVLDVQARDMTETPDALRARGVVPAVSYGPKDAPTHFVVDTKKVQKLWKEAGETTMVTLKGVGADKDVLIHDVQVHPLSGVVSHVDFYVVEKGKKVEVEVPLEFVGAAPAEKAGLIVTKALHEIEIEVDPRELPHHLPVDVSGLSSVGDHITAGDVKLPPSAKLLTDSHEIVASVIEPKIEKEETAAPAAEAPAPAKKA